MYYVHKFIGNEFDASGQKHKVIEDRAALITSNTHEVERFFDELESHDEYILYWKPVNEFNAASRWALIVRMTGIKGVKTHAPSTINI